MKKIKYMLNIAITSIFAIISLFIFGENAYAEEYPSVEALSNEEKELLPYYNNGWSLNLMDSNYYGKNYVADVYYLGKKVKRIDSELTINGEKFYQNRTDRHMYAITDNHQLFMLCRKTGKVLSDDDYEAMIRYDIDTDSYKIINSVSYICNVNGYRYATGIVSNGEDIYLLIDDGIIYKYDKKQDRFIYLSTIAEGVKGQVVYDSDEKVWVSAFGDEFFKYDFEAGICVKEHDDCIGLLKGSKFSLWQKKTGNYYYNKESKVLNENTGLYRSYTSLYSHNESTNKDTELIKTDNAGFQGGVSYHLKFITNKGVVVIQNNNHQQWFVFNESKNSYKLTYDDMGIPYWLSLDNHDMWNFYVDGEVYPIYEPAIPRIIGTKATYADRITVNWSEVSTATGYNVYVNGKKVNESILKNTTYTIKGLSKNTIYKIEVTAVNNIGESNSNAVSVKTGSVILGDINGDEKINIIDAMKIFHYVSGRNKNIEISKADINGDGKVNIIDAMKIFHYISGRNKDY